MANEIQTAADSVMAEGNLIVDNVAMQTPEPTIWQQLYDLVIGGGPVMLALGIASVIGLTILITKLIQFSMSGMWSKEALEKVLDNWQRGRVDKAVQTAQDMRHPAGIVLLAAMRGVVQRGVHDETVREEVERVAARQISHFNRHLNILDIISQLAPLLGLLGTILGMISAFQALQGAGVRADPSVLAGGIWEALLTTAAGLTVAIPMTVFFFLLDGCVQSMRYCMEDSVTRVFTLAHEAHVLPLHAPVNSNADVSNSQHVAKQDSKQAMESYAL